VTKAKASDVRYQSAEFAPVAQCHGVLEHAPEKYGHDTREVVVACPWSYQPHLGGSPNGSAVGHARRHAQENPGHEVVVIRTTRSVYWVDTPEPGQESTT
jgi:hypothetical protein